MLKAEEAAHAVIKYKNRVMNRLISGPPRHSINLACEDLPTSAISASPRSLESLT
ncbi:MAG: hypothetical protein MZV63_49490 [Marinilabiliales bacterium]|nr:hypothetical protein [Marinilabiliales bacterium]